MRVVRNKRISYTCTVFLVVTVVTDDGVNTYKVAFCASIAELIGVALGCSLSVLNHLCNAVSTWGKKLTRALLVSSTLPFFCISINLASFFFHVDNVDWLMLYCLQRSIALVPAFNWFRILSFSFNVRSLCCRLDNLGVGVLAGAGGVSCGVSSAIVALVINNRNATTQLL